MANNTFSDLWARAGSLARTAAAATRHAADSAKLSINIAAEEENLPLVPDGERGGYRVLRQLRSAGHPA